MSELLYLPPLYPRPTEGDCELPPGVDLARSYFSRLIRLGLTKRAKEEFPDLYREHIIRTEETGKGETNHEPT